MRRLNFGRIALAAAALFGLGGAAVSRAQSKEGPAQAAALPQAVTKGVKNPAIARAFVVHSRGGNAPVWMAIAKRGNRRGRSRWNYNR